MKHLRKEDIFDFLEMERHNKKKNKVETHLSDCEECKSLLEETKEEICYVNEKLDFLAPEYIPSQIPPIIFKDGENVEKSSLLYKLVRSTIQVPSIVFVLMISIILIFSVLLFNKSDGLIENISSTYEKSNKNNVRIVTQERIETIRLDFNISEFKPIIEPNFIVLRGDIE